MVKAIKTNEAMVGRAFVAISQLNIKAVVIKVSY
jgi:hypothetical protein